MSEFVGMQQLGFVDTSNQQDVQLGDEYDIVVTNHTAGDNSDVVSNSGRVRIKLLKNTSGGTLAAGTFVKSNTSGNMAYEVTGSAADNPSRAVVDPTLTAAVPNGAKFFGVIYGETKVLSGAAITKGATLAAGTGGKAVTNDLSTVAKLAGAAGVALEAAAGADALTRAFVDFRVIK